MDDKLRQRLDERRGNKTLRTLSSYAGMIDFISNDYLGLSNFQLESAVYKGSTGSRLISGNDQRIVEIEAELASFFGYDSALCFNSGYDANLGLLGSIPQKGDVVLYDKAIHASVRDGLRLSFANNYSFEHNSASDLERLLRKFSGKTVYVAIEGLYSMHGDLSPIKEITALCNEYGAYLIMDEAHSGGIFGSEGKGWTAENGVDGSVFIKLITFGKAYGGHGAVVLCSNDVKEYLINFARPFIYSTALPVNDYERMISVVNSQRNIEALNRNIKQFRKGVKEALLSSDEHSPIQIIRVSDKSKLKQLENELLKDNIAVKAIYTPTVAPGEECLRLCFHSYNTEEEITKLLSILNSNTVHA